ncbi:MAG: efflux RND transporter periplasmic adaptor subunit [Glaciecola sp.]|jgi:membrane fusion protein (multidrug efflux system)|nr:efflux RND transporter periplasmic adaptor subunit [Glaciecola sp.]MDG2098982.1 efflux RND transporter periplasmic adaptor subunit [Glaciecola sp.]
MSLFRWCVAIVICVAVFVSLSFIKYNQVMAAIAFGESFPEPSETVHAQSLTTTQWRTMSSLSAETVAPQLISLTNQQSGIITAVNGEAGQAIAKGSVFVQIDISEESAQLAAIAAQIALAQLDVDRLGRLIKVNASSKEQYDRALAQLDVVNAQADAIKANIAKKQVMIPFPGVLGLHSLEVGQYIEANSELTSLMGDIDPIWVEVDVPQALSAIDVGRMLAVNYQGRKINGSIIAKSQVLNPVNRSVKIRIAIDNSDKALSPGSFVQVEIPSLSQQSAYVVADTAVRYSPLGSFVYVLKLDDNNQYRAVRQEVTVLAKQGNDVIIAADFVTDSPIATLGAFKLREGLWVKIAEQQ